MLGKSIDISCMTSHCLLQRNNEIVEAPEVDERVQEQDSARTVH